MAQRTIIFRTALQVSARRVGELDEIGLGVLMLQLMCAQAYRCSLPTSSIIVNSEETAKDDGCDGWTDAPPVLDERLGSTDTCWQFKAGGAGAPSRSKGEVRKFIPAVTLGEGGRLVVVAGGSNNGVKGENDRRAVLVNEAKLARVPHKRTCVRGSEQLASWCNEHPAVAAELARRPSGLGKLGDWANSDDRQSPWHSTPDIQSILQSQQVSLDFAQGEVHHLHIFGQPGVGKTRFALELCRSAEWQSTVIYARQAEDRFTPDRA